MTSRAGVVQTVSYDSNGLLYQITDSFGNALTITRNAQGGIGSVTANNGASIQYSYDSVLRLAGVTNLDGTTNGYVYGNGLAVGRRR